jgi:hypothetical protein
MSEVNRELIREKVKARELALATLTLVEDELRPFSDEAKQAYLEQLREHCDRLLPPKPPVVPATGLQEITEIEARRFERHTLPFGKYVDRTIGAVVELRGGASYLAWLADQRFIDQLRLYLKRPEIKRLIADDVSDIPVRE